MMGIKVNHWINFSIKLGLSTKQANDETWPIVGQTNKLSEQKWFNFHDSSKILTYQQCTNPKCEKYRIVCLLPLSPVSFPFLNFTLKRDSEYEKLKESSIPDEICMFTNLIQLFQRFTSIFWQNIKLTLLICQVVIQQPIERKHSRITWCSCEFAGIVFLRFWKRKQEHNPLSNFHLAGT